MAHTSSGLEDAAGGSGPAAAGADVGGDPYAFCAAANAGGLARSRRARDADEPRCPAKPRFVEGWVT